MFKTSLVLFLAIKQCYAACNNLFPKTIGADDGITALYDIDANNKTIYACGFTESGSLKGYYTSDYNPFIAAFDISSTKLKWGYSDPGSPCSGWKI